MSETPSEPHTAHASERDDGQRVDRWLANCFPDFSRARIQALIGAGHLKLDGQTIENPSYRVKCGMRADLEIPPAAPATPRAQDVPLNVVYEDADLIVIDKPAGLVVHPGAGNMDGTLVNALLAHCGDSLSGIGGVARPGIVHRIDKETSGLLVIAKNDAAHAGLSTQFADHSITRAYQAVVHGLPMPPLGTVNAPIGRDPRHRTRMAVTTKGSKHAITHYRMLEPLGARHALMECRLETGRTHQIRVHMRHIGHPLVGDPVYAPGYQTPTIPDPANPDAPRPFDRQALHAGELGFVHPQTGADMRFDSPLPADMCALIARLRAADTPRSL